MGLPPAGVVARSAAQQQRQQRWWDHGQQSLALEGVRYDAATLGLAACR
jgi:hypothetical protein